MQFLGCGAADYDWSRYCEAGVLGSTASLLNDSILLACGPAAAKALERFDIAFESISTVINTHSHSDHFNVEVLKKNCRNALYRLLRSSRNLPAS